MLDMGTNIDHYRVLGLPSGEEGAKLTEKQISKAYKAKALELHPDKRPDDSDAHINFQKIKSSYDILKNEKSRRLFDDVLHVKCARHVSRAQRDTKRSKMANDLEARERMASAADESLARARQAEEMVSRKFREEIVVIRAMAATKRTQASSTLMRERDAFDPSKESEGSSSIDKSRMLKVSWEKVVGADYTSDKLRDFFSKFGEVEDVVLRSSSKRTSSALVVMATKDAAVAAMRSGSSFDVSSNPLIVMPLEPSMAAECPFPSNQHSLEANGLNNLVGAGYKVYEDSVMEKLHRKIASVSRNSQP